MVKTPMYRRMDRFFKIWECIYSNPLITVYDIWQKTGISRNTIAGDLNYMETQGILDGPFLTMKTSYLRRGYVRLAQFEDPRFWKFSEKTKLERKKMMLFRSVNTSSFSFFPEHELVKLINIQ